VTARSADDIAPILTEFVTSKTFRANELARVAIDEPLLGGLMDSVDLLNFVIFIEDEFEIRIDDSDVTKENFATISAVAELVTRRLDDRESSVDPPPQPATGD
jgi:acyl carrier protein